MVSSVRFRTGKLYDCSNHLLPPNIFWYISSVIKQRHLHAFQTFQSLQIRKYADYSTSTCPESNSQPETRTFQVTNSESFVKNLSNRSLTSEELQLLQKGLNLNLHKKLLTPQEIVFPREAHWANYSRKSQTKSQSKYAISSKTEKPITLNLPTDKWWAFTSLRNKKSIRITKNT